jgi:hypothetical protein
MSTPTAIRQQRSWHLACLERFLSKMRIYGTALVDADDELEDTWNGLLVWEISQGAENGIVIRCQQGLPGGKWRYCHDNGAVITDVPNRLQVHHELATVFGAHPVEPTPSR